jgi:hypothetical protein
MRRKTLRHPDGWSFVLKPFGWAKGGCPFLYSGLPFQTGTKNLRTDASCGPFGHPWPYGLWLRAMLHPRKDGTACLNHFFSSSFAQPVCASIGTDGKQVGTN